MRSQTVVLATWDIRSWKTMDFSNGCPPRASEAADQHNSLPALRPLCYYTNHPVASLAIGVIRHRTIHCHLTSKKQQAQQEDWLCSYHQSRRHAFAGFGWRC
jgi:hypothetical protein